jgi:transposase-like protein
MTCHNCSSLCKKFGKFGPQRIQRYRCKKCKRTFSEEHETPIGPLGDMRISLDKAETILRLMLEGMSVRSIQRITGAHQKTILDLLVIAGEKCERIMNEKIKNIPVKDVEADEIWGFVKMKRNTRIHKGIDDSRVGDTFTFVGMERNTKLVLAWHLGDRDAVNTEAFIEKLSYATSGHFQITTDGHVPYIDAVSYSLGTRASITRS